MKAILSRLFNHEELNREEAKNLLLNITKGRYNDSQIAALLTVFQMRGVKVEELIGFREALLTTRVPIDFSAYKPIDIVGTGRGLRPECGISPAESPCGLRSTRSGRP